MIDSISLKDVATFGNSPAEIAGLCKLNIFYGSNGTGKTTIGRVIADQKPYPSCSIIWQGGTKLQALVYNQDFVDSHFYQSAELKGVFTLGERQLDVIRRINDAIEKRANLTQKIQSLNQTLGGADGRGGKIGEYAVLEDRLRDKCWAQKQKYDSKFQRGFEGFRNSAENFKNKVLAEQSANKAETVTLAELERRAARIYGDALAGEPLVAMLDTDKLVALEADPVLKKKVLGKRDVDIAEMIRRLGNSDWVREGLGFYNDNDSKCPFCQRVTDAAFSQSLNDYFDEIFVADMKAVEALIASYSFEATRVQEHLAAVVATPPKFLDVSRLAEEMRLLDAKLALNGELLAKKKNEASQVIQLESTQDACLNIKSLLEAANCEATENNRVVANLASEKEALTSQVWRFVLDEMRDDLAEYSLFKIGLDKAIASLRRQAQETLLARAGVEAEIRDLEKQTTSIQPTIDGINTLLASFGFRGFRLAKAESGASYKLVRSDGSDARATLSEGEKTFVTFLYFYHLLKGSDSDSGVATDRVVVFDDPVSSLDSDVLFVVSSLIKGVFDEVRSCVGHVKQVFVLTHNVYFHKEVAYNSKRKNVAMSDESFWVVRKPGAVSIVEKHLVNPIKTSYDLLWVEVRSPDRSSLSIQNTLRRILENYFKILGGINFDQLCSLFEGREKVLCNSLCSWVHDGSHYAHDDVYVAIDSSMIEAYLQVFRKVFIKAGHYEHYKMMMGDAFVDHPDSAVLERSSPEVVNASAP